MVETASVSCAQPPLVAGERAAARARLNRAARLVTFNGTSACTLVDMSRSGAKVRAAECPRIGAMLVVEGLPIELFGTVRWSRAGAFGLEFERAIATEQVIAMRSHADGETQRQEQNRTQYARSWVTGINA